MNELTSIKARLTERALQTPAGRAIVSKQLDELVDFVRGHEDLTFNVEEDCPPTNPDYCKEPPTP